MNHLRAMVAVLFVLFIFILAVQNYDALSIPVKFRVNLVFVDYESDEIPVSFVAVIAFLVGVISLGLYGMTERFRLKRQIKTLLKERKEKEKELNSLRNLPVTTGNMNSDQTTGT
jgi:uncharacterized integral membrane protein